jgi:hypothetical protein
MELKKLYLVLTTVGLLATLAIGIGTTSVQAALTYQNWVFPSPGDPGYGYINYVKATKDGLELSLSWNGLKKGFGADGAKELAIWTAQLYAKIPQKGFSSIDFLREPMGREINYHCIAYFT